MFQDECLNSTQVAKKVCELCNLKYSQDERRIWIDYCRQIKNSKYASDNIDYVEVVNDEERDCSIFLGYNKTEKIYLVGKESEEERYS